MENNRDELLEQGGDPMFGDEFDLAKASAPFQTLKRLMHTARHERLRLVVVLFSVILYTALSIAALLTAPDRQPVMGKYPDGPRAGRGVPGHLAAGRAANLYSVPAVLRLLGLFHPAIVPDAQLCRAPEPALRTQLSEKLNRLPLAFFDRTRRVKSLADSPTTWIRCPRRCNPGCSSCSPRWGLIVGSIVMMLLYHVWMTLIFIGFLLLSMLVTNCFPSTR